MADLVPALALACVALAFGIASRVLRTESGGRWEAAWALLALAGLSVQLQDWSPAFGLASHAFAGAFPFVVLAGAARYAGYPEPRWALPVALAVVGARVVAVALERHEIAASIALVVAPSAILAAAWLVAVATRRRGWIQRLQVPGLVLLAAVSAYHGFLDVEAHRFTSVPWLLWIAVSIPLAALQIVAGVSALEMFSGGLASALRASQAQLRDTERAARLGSFSWEAGSTVVDCSDETRRILGIEGGPRVPLERLRETIDPEALRAGAEIRRAALETRGAVAGDARIRLRDGGERVLSVRIEPHFTADGRLRSVQGTTRDVTEQRRDAAALRRSEQRLRAILSSLVGTRVAVISRSGALLEAHGDKDSARRYGLSAPELEALRDVASFCRPDEIEETRRLVEAVFDTGEVHELRRAVEFPGGSFWFDATLCPLRAESGEVKEVLVVARDVTDQLETEHQNREIAARLLQLQRLDSLGVLAGGIAHDFNNILAGILGNTELVLRELQGGSPPFEAMRAIQSASERGASLTRRLLAYAGQVEPSFRPVELGSLLREMLPLLRPAVPAESELLLEVPESELLVKADDGQIRQVVMNLVSNAAEALGEKGEIRVRLSRIDADAQRLGECIGGAELVAGPYVSIGVSDTGSGIPPADLSRVFEPFFTTKFSGRGLGLASVLGVVRGHGGAIRVESTLGGGSLFEVLLPALEPGAERNAAQPASPPSREGLRLLIVDDDELVRGTAARMLSSLGFDALEAGGMEEALELARGTSQRLDAVVLDLTMPEHDGIALLEALRALQPGLPVVVMSGHSAEHARERIAGRGRVVFLEKPFRLASLRASLEEALATPESDAERLPG